ATFMEPVGVAVDSAGNVYVADETLASVMKIPPGGGSQTPVGSGLASPVGVAVDGAGNVYVTEDGPPAVVVQITPGGVQVNLATTGLSLPFLLAVDRNYNLFIPDSNNSNVIEFSTKFAPLGFANVCIAGNPAPCSRTATMNFSLGGKAVTNVGIATLGAANLDYSVVSSNCGAVTNPCNVQVQFSPKFPGTRAGAVVLTDNSAPPIKLSTALGGAGLSAEIVFDPPTIGSTVPGFTNPKAVAVD